MSQENKNITNTIIRFLINLSFVVRYFFNVINVVSLMYYFYQTRQKPVAFIHDMINVLFRQKDMTLRDVLCRNVYFFLGEISSIPHLKQYEGNTLHVKL